MQQIPFTPGDPSYEFETQLGSETVRFVVYWNSRDEAWYFDLRSADNRPIAHGIKIVLGVPLGRRVAHPIFRRGMLVAIDVSGTGRDATLDDLGVRVRVVYMTGFEYAALIATAAK